MSIKPLFLSFLFVVGVSALGYSQDKSDCKRIGNGFQKKVCSGVENNKASYIKDLMERKSGAYTLNKVLEWTKGQYDCFYCDDEPGFRGGSLLRKVVFDSVHD